NMNPTRASIWDDELFRAHTSTWGSFHDVARSLIEHEASVLVTPAANYLAVASRWVEALLDVYAGRAETTEALESAAAEIDLLVAAGPGKPEATTSAPPPRESRWCWGSSRATERGSMSEQEGRARRRPARR